MNFKPLVKLLRNGIGDSQITGDYSLTPEQFVLISPTETSYVISTFFIHMLVSIGNLHYDQYGDIPQLINGIILQVENSLGDIILDLTAAETLNTNYDFLHYGDIETTDFNGQYKSVKFIWNFENTYLSPLVLSKNDKLVLIAHDDFMGLSKHHGMIHGRQVPNYGVTP